jgi:hypothetical protein
MNNISYRANGQLAYHVLEAMDGILEAASSGRYYDMRSHVARPAALEQSVWDLRE